MKKIFTRMALISIGILGWAIQTYAQEATNAQINSILEVQQYNRAIHIMAMLLIGFGFFNQTIRQSINQ